MRTSTDIINQAYRRMRNAMNRGTGCHLTAEMMQELSMTLLGEWCEQDDIPQDNE